MSKVVRLEELFPDQLQRQLEIRPVLLIPIGTIEWHSHHLPLGLDGLKAGAIAAALSERTGAVVCPTSWWAAGGVPFPYTLRLAGTGIQALLEEVFSQFAEMGFQIIMALNGHYGLDNTLAVRRAAVRCAEQTGATVVPVAEYELLLELGAKGDHAGTWETALLWSTRPELVRTSIIEGGPPLEGVVGDHPRNASRELGERGFGRVVEELESIMTRTLDFGADDRDAFLAALRTGNNALEVVEELRKVKPRSEVPPVQTQAWYEYLRAFHSGRYGEALTHASAKESDPSS